MRESYIERKLVTETKKRGGLCEKWNSGTAGWPDRIILMPDGKVGFVEVKAPERHILPRVLQGSWEYLLQLLMQHPSQKRDM